MFKAISTIGKRVATGKAGASLGLQSPHTPNAIVRIGRFLYVGSGLWILLTWYTGYVNERTVAGNGPQLVLGGKVSGGPDRPPRNPKYPQSLDTSNTQDNNTAPSSSTRYVTTPDKSGRTLYSILPSQLGVPGSAVAGYLWSATQKMMPPFNRSRYTALTHVASKIASQFGLHITSGYRPGSTGAGGRPDLHSVGLAFDLVGPMSNMKRAAKWASTNPAMFQEIFIHNEGSGEHLHIGFYPDAAATFTAATNRLTRASAGR